MGDHKITRAALGRAAVLGSLYDARRDDFCLVSILNDTLPSSYVSVQDTKFSKLHFVKTDNFSEKAERLDVNAELQVSVLAGLFTMEGSARYLSDQKQSARTVKMSVVYHIKTKTEMINICHKNLSQFIACNAISSCMGTHVVMGISWGANCVFSCFYENKENRDVREIEGNLKAKLKKPLLSIEAGASADFKESDKSDLVNFQFQFEGDILSDNNLPSNFEDAWNYMAQVPSMVKMNNNGKGIPLTYHLLPISIFQKLLNVSDVTVAIAYSLQETGMLMVVQMFEEISKAQQQFNDFRQDAVTYEYCVNEDDLAAISSFQNELIIQASSLRAELSKLLQKMRSTKCKKTEEMDQLKQFLQNLQQKVYSPKSIKEKLKQWKLITEKLELAQKIHVHKAKYIGRGTSLEDDIAKNSEATPYILCFSQNAKQEEPERWARNWQMFFQKTRNHSCIVVDIDFHPEHRIENTLIYFQEQTTGFLHSMSWLSRLKKIENGVTGFTWIPHQFGNVIKGTVVAGKEGNETVIVARARVEDGLIPGKYFLSWPNALIPLGGKEHKVYQFEVLTAKPGAYTWVSSTGRTVPAGAVPCGWCPHSKTEYYIGRATINGCLTAGKVVGDTCFIPWHGKEIPLKVYEVLIYTPEIWWEPHGHGNFTNATPVIGGKENNSTSYVARARLEGGLIPGKFFRDCKHAYIPYGGKEHRPEKYEILVAKNEAWKWVSVNGGKVPVDSIYGGWCPWTKAEYHIGRAYVEGHLVPGKVIRGICWIPWHGKEIQNTKYDVLVYN